MWTTNHQGRWRWGWWRGVGAVALTMWGIGLGGRVGGWHWKHFVNSPNVSIWCTKFVTLAHPPNPNPTTRTHTTTNTLIVHVPTHLPTNLGGCSTAFCITNVHHKMLHYAQIKHSPKNITQKQKQIDILEFKYTISFSLWLWFFIIRSWVSFLCNQ